MLLRGSSHGGAITYQMALDLTRSGRGDDSDGRRAELIRLAERAELRQVVSLHGG